jgi:hypothetical protein
MVLPRNARFALSYRPHSSTGRIEMPNRVAVVGCRGFGYDPREFP